MKSKKCDQCRKTLRFHWGRPPRFCVVCLKAFDKRRRRLYFRKYYEKNLQMFRARSYTRSPEQRKRDRACGRRWFRAHHKFVPKENKTCKECGGSFAGYKCRVFCSKKCSQRWFNRRQSPERNRERTALWACLHPVKYRRLYRRNNALQGYARKHGLKLIGHIPLRVRRQIEKRVCI